VSPNLIPTPLLQGGLDLADEILQNWIAQVESDLTMEGVTEIKEIAIPIGDEPPIPATSAALLPGVYAYCTCGPAPEWIACQTLGLNYTVHWIVAVSDGRRTEQRKRHEQVREEIVAIFGGFDIQGSTLFLNRSHTCVHFDDISVGEPQLGDGNPYLLWSVNTMRCRVAMPNPRME
jgi:hypothetical protein